MAGHSKWSKIKRKKAANDAKRGKLFTKLLKEVQVAARVGGANPEGNARLKTAIQAAQAQSVPTSNIDRAISRGAGDSEGEDYEEIVYEGYGPGGVAVLVKTLTDNRNRTVAEVRHAFSKYNGSLGSTNSVAYQFEEQGIFTLPLNAVSEEKLFDLVLEAGASDVKKEDDNWEIISEPNQFGAVRDAIETLGKEFEAELVPVPQTTVSVSGQDAETLLKLLDALDDLDDVQNVTANFEMDDQSFEQAAAS